MKCDLCGKTGLACACTLLMFREHAARLKIDLEVMESCARPQGPGLCGHPAEYAYTPDGKGKQILCMQCRAEKAEARASKYETALKGIADSFDACSSLDARRALEA